MTSPLRSRLLAGLVDVGLVLAWALVVVGTAAVLISVGPLRGVGPLGLNLVGMTALRSVRRHLAAE